MPTSAKDSDERHQSKEDASRTDFKDGPMISESDDNGSYRRSLRWLSFSKSKAVFGFDHLPTAKIPQMSSQLRGLSVCFEKISGWRLPAQIYKDVSTGSFELSIQLSLSMYHVSSASFFGSTWMGEPVPLGDVDDLKIEALDIEFSDVIYMVSRLTDPSCVGVVELVVSKIDSRRKLVAAQYG